MKSILKVLLFCLIIENILSSKQSLKMKMTKISKSIKDISTLKQKNLRKLEATDINSQNTSEIENSTNSVQNNSSENNST